MKPLVIFFALSFLCACGAPPETEELRCGEDEVRAVVNGEEAACYVRCDAGCPEQTWCYSGACLPKAVPVEMDPDDIGPVATDAGDAGYTDAAVDAATEPDIPVDPLEAMCLEAMHKWTDCVFEQCTVTSAQRDSFELWAENILTGGADSKPCPERMEENDRFRERIEFLASVECGDATQRRALCGEFGLSQECACEVPTGLGEACTDDSQCDGGELQGWCSNHPYEPGGACTAVFCPVSDQIELWGGYYWDGCGEGNLCEMRGTFDSAGNLVGRYGTCVAGCSSQADCTRTGYSCQTSSFYDIATGPVAARACSLECISNSDCGGGARCNADVRACEFACESSQGSFSQFCGLIGGTCTPDQSGTTWCVLP